MEKMSIPYLLGNVDMLYKSAHHCLYLVCRAWIFKNCDEMSVTIKIFGRWEFAVEDDVYIRNGS